MTNKMKFKESREREKLDLLKKIYDFLKDLPKILDNEKIKSVVVFGSASRPKDFVLGISDVDVMAITHGKPRKRHYGLNVYGLRVEVSVLTAEEVKNVFKSGDPLSFMLKHGILLYDDGTYALMEKKVKITEVTRKRLRRSAIAALGLALESYFHGSYAEASSYLYHSVRHLVRYRFSLTGKAENYPVGDQEVYEKAEDLKGTFMKLVRQRRRPPDKKKVKALTEEVIKLTSKELGLEAPSLKDMESIQGKIGVVAAHENKRHLIFRLALSDSKILEFKGKETKKVNSLFP